MVQHNTIDHTGITGVSTVSYASNANAVSSTAAGGAATTVSRGNHVHLGVRQLAHTSNTFTGNITLTASGSLGITMPSAGTLNFNAVDTTGGGSGSGSGAGTLLALKEEKAAHTYSTTSSTLADVDATNMAVTFTAPASGNILVRLTAYCDIAAAAAAPFGRWSLRESTSDIAGAGGSVIRAHSATVGADNTASVVFKLTGVTGGSHTYKWSYAVTDNATLFRILVGAGGNDQPPAVMEVWELA